MRSRSAVLVALTGLVLGACAGNRDLREPGEKLGTFTVTGKLVGTSCGKADPTFRYDVRLSREGDRLYWVQGTVPVSGTIDAASTVRLVASTEARVVAPDEATGSPGCTMARVDTLAATLSGAPVTGFSGVIVYRFDVKSGDCASELAAAGGDYTSLPCTMTYEVEATQKDRP